MKAQVDRKALVEALGRVAPVANPKSTLPLAAHVLISVGPNRIGLLATDFQTTASASVDAEAEDAGSHSVDARAFDGVIRSLSGDSVSLSFQPTDVVVTCGRSTFELPTMHGAEFPKVVDSDGLGFQEVDGEQLARLIALTAGSAADGDWRPHLAGAHFDATGDTLALRATNGGQGARARSAMGGIGEWRCMVPTKSALAVKGAVESAESVGIAVSGGYMHVQTPAGSLAVKLMADEFPKFDKVVDNGIRAASFKAVAPRAELVAALKRVGLVATKQAGVSFAQLAFDGDTLTITAEESGRGKCVDRVSCSYDGESLALSASPAALAEMLSRIPDDQAHIQVGPNMAPIVVVSESFADFTGVVMPMREVGNART